MYKGDMEETKKKEDKEYLSIDVDESQDSDDEISIDFSKVKNFFQKKKKDKIEEAEEKVEEIEEGITETKEELEKESKQTYEEEKEESDDEEISIDFSKIKDFFKRKKEKVKKGSKKSTDKESSEDEISIDWKNFINFFKKNKYIIPVLLILIAVFFSTFFRMYPVYLPATDNWATSSVHNSVKANIKNQINQQYPNLPDANKNMLVESQFKKVLEQEKQQINDQIRATSDYFKAKMQDDAGQTYLLAIDPYYWYASARNYINHGQFGDSYNENGEKIFSLRNGREDMNPTSIKFHPLIGAWLYKFLHFFNKNVSLMGVIFIMPVILIGLSIIPAFFIGKRVGGNLGGFFAAMIVAINSSLLSRTPAGFSDTDSYNIFFPLFILWMFIEAFEEKDLKKSVKFISIGGLLTGLYSTAWGGWWYVFDFVLVTTGIYLIYQFILNIKHIKNGFVKYLNIPVIKNSIIIGGSFFITSAIFVSLFKGFNSFVMPFRGPLSVIKLKEVAITTIWPNVLTTVAEFNKTRFGAIISQMGGQLLFSIAIIGIILTVLIKNNENKRDVKYAIFLTIWFIGTLYGFTKGVRFAILMVPAFAIAFGVSIGVIYNYLSRWLSKGLHVNKYISHFIIIASLLLLLISPIQAAHRTALNEIPSMNDEWYDSLIAIKENSEDAIITSWWDFGHWFYSISERRVTFDGADQGERIHWVGKSLLTSDEDESVGILKMLNCGQEKAPHILEKYFENNTIKSIDILNKIILQDKKQTILTLKKENLSDKAIEDIIKVTHCDDLIDQYYITSEDMIGKAGVWGHFGSWDFKRAKMWKTVHELDYNEGIKILKEEFNLNEDEADNIYYEIQNNKADRWVSGWPGYLSGLNSCNEKDNLLKCGNGLEVNLVNMEAYISTQQGKILLNSLAFINNKKEFEVKMFEGETARYSAALLPNGKSIIMDPKLAGSMFTRLFFFDGHGLKHFKILSDKRQITGGRIQVWKVGWEEGETNILEELKVIDIS
ncbi:hypothetical protein CEE44_02095 [Candidatus Woesearchaeota archaeon B3_Woes]|nr:MAG: hypothetical protein CEE44_02095 [Candidatus Woesearchaeota archaeon B3_Woes]